MHKNLMLPILLLGLVTMAPAQAEDAQDIVAKMLELQDERREGVNRYTVEQKVMGQTVKTVFERTTVTGPDGKPVETFQVQMPEGFTDVQGDSAVTREEFDDMAENAVHAIDELAAAAKLVGTESVDGKKAYHIAAEDVDRVEEFEAGTSFTMNTVHVWVDTDMYVPLRMTMDGHINTDGTDRPVTMEMLHQDYRDVPGSDMYESYRQVMRMNGVMTDETREQVEQARAGLEEFEKQMASMPESQRQMMMNMMGDQIEMMRKLAAGEGLEIITEVVAITVE